MRFVLTPRDRFGRRKPGTPRYVSQTEFERSRTTRKRAVAPTTKEQYEDARANLRDKGIVMKEPADG